MKLRDFGLLTDENIDPSVVQCLVAEGFDVLVVCQAGLQGTSDRELLERAFAEQRLVVTHGSDFGTLAVSPGEPVVGIVYLRPGHIDPAFSIGSLSTILATDPDVMPPFILVARRHDSTVAMRIRNVVTHL